MYFDILSLAQYLGSGNWYGPDYWMQHDVIIVTVNYRLGPFGFLTLGIDEAAGNQVRILQKEFRYQIFAIVGTT